jgi:hypothetical protein
LPQAVLDGLEECLGRSKVEVSVSGASDLDAQIFCDSIRHLTLANGVSDALAWYVSDCRFQDSERDIRAQLKKLEKSVEQFKAALPAEHEALGTFIRDTYTGTAFLKDSLKPDEDALVPLQDAWQERYGFLAMREHLDVMKDYVAAAKECLGKKKPLEHRKAALIRGLARTWQQLTGIWPTSGRDPKTSHQTGPFVDFVRAACSVLPEGVGPEPLDAAIRKTLEAGRPR